ncbi:MAG TPA: radical SAM family heme chaperone HemW [Desulfomonilia bacterium]
MGLHIYIHIPYCISKCRYCGFSSIENSNPPQERYVEAVLAEAEMYANILSADDSISTIYFGGGTPTLFSALSIGKVIDGLNSLWQIEADSEVSIEANPETISRDHALQLKTAGVNRVSLGIQSFSNRLLGFLGRVHDSDKAIDAFGSLRAAGFDNINIDMMYSIPTQNLSELKFDLERITELDPEHVSAYMFSPDTRWAQTVGPLSEDQIERFFYTVLEKLSGCGFNQYEISNFARTGCECRHNLAYWRYSPYIGLGAAAVSRLDGIRSTNESEPERYMSLVLDKKRPVVSEDILDDNTMDFEKKFLLLRTVYGIPEELMPKNIPPGLFEIRDGNAVLTPKGMLLSDEIFSML